MNHVDAGCMTWIRWPRDCRIGRDDQSVSFGAVSEEQSQMAQMIHLGRREGGSAK